MSHILKKMSFLFVFSFFILFNSANRGSEFLVVNHKARRHVVETKSLVIFNNLIYLMRKCDKFIDLLEYRKTNLGFYFLTKGKVSNIFKVRRDFIKDIDEKIVFLQDKKKEYANFIGKLYRLSEPFIQGTFLNLSDSNIDILVSNFIEKIESILPKNYSDKYFDRELQVIKNLVPIDKQRAKTKKNILLITSSIVSSYLLYRYRKEVCSLCRNFLKNQILRPLINLRDWLFTNYDEDDLTNMTPEEILRDLEAQKSVVKNKIKDLIVELDPQVDWDSLDGIIQQAKSEGLEAFVTKCIRKAGKTRDKKAKIGWIEWLLFGNSINRIFGMPPKEKFLEIEIKALLSRITATKLLVDTKRGIDANKLTMILGSFLPIMLISYSVCKMHKKFYNWYYFIEKKKKDINNIIFKINDIINRNIGENKMSAEDQGFLCYLRNKFILCLEVVSENVRSSITKDLSYISSSINSMDKKLQILQSMKIMLYTG